MSTIELSQKNAKLQYVCWSEIQPELDRATGLPVLSSDGATQAMTREQADQLIWRGRYVKFFDSGSEALLLNGTRVVHRHSETKGDGSGRWEASRRR